MSKQKQTSKQSSKPAAKQAATAAPEAKPAKAGRPHGWTNRVLDTLIGRTLDKTNVKTLPKTRFQAPICPLATSVAELSARMGAASGNTALVYTAARVNDHIAYGVHGCGSGSRYGVDSNGKPTYKPLGCRDAGIAAAVDEAIAKADAAMKAAGRRSAKRS